MYVFQIIIQFIVQLCYIVLPLAVRLVSSANMLAEADFKQFGKSFT